MNDRFYLLYDLEIILLSHFCFESIDILPCFRQLYNGRHYITPLISKSLVVYPFLHGVICLPDTMSYD